jgi:hypothetical protein
MSMTDKIEELQHLPLMEVVTKLVRRQSELQSRLELVKLVISITEKKPEMMETAPPELDGAIKAIPEMEDHLLEIGSIIYWLSKVR